MYKLVLNVILILTILASICISVIKPEMHKRVLVYNSDYKIVQDNSEPEVESNIPTKQQEPEQVSVTTKLEQNVEKVEIPQVTYQPVVQKTSNSLPKQEVKKVTQTTSQTPVSTKTQMPSDIKNLIKRVESNSAVKTPVQTTQVQPKPVQTVKQETAVQPQKQQPVQVKKPTTITLREKTPVTVPAQTQTLTQQQEEIAWNIWRSNLQNQIMKDTNMPAIPQGTIFKFTFDVDKYGKITNVQTWSTNSKYTPHAIQYIAPVIRSYQGRSILNFPKGSNRTSTHVEGAWKISTQSRYSSPSDYNDTERIIK